MSAWAIQARFAAAVLCILFFAGCDDGRPALVPVSGHVLIDGKPLTYGFIRFLPPNARASSAKLDENGRFALKCLQDGDGVVVGQHSVAVLGAEQISSVRTLWHAPKKYVDYRTSGLAKEIMGPTSDLEINI